MADFIVAGIILLVVIAAISYIAKAKRRGVKCIGCPAAGQCAHHKNGTSIKGACGCHEDTE